MSYLEPGLVVVGLADAVLGGDGVGAEEHAVKAHPLQGFLGKGADKALADAAEPTAEAVHLDALRVGGQLLSVLISGVVTDSFSKPRRSWARAPTVEPTSSRMLSPGTITEAAQRALACFCSNASPVR